MFERASVTILVVEDDPGHARLIEKHLRRSNVTNEIVILGDGQQAVDFLLSKGQYAGCPCPSLLWVLLDLNLPVLNGYQVLERLRANQSSRQIPVVILTTAEDNRDVARCYELGCNAFVTKPVNYEQFIETIYRLGLFLSIAKIPDGD